MACGHWATCGHFPAVSLSSLEREALTSEHVVVQSLSHGLQHARLLCPPPSLGICSDSSPLCRDALQPLHPLLPPSPFAFNLCSIRVFSSELALYIRWPKSRNFSFSISPSSEYLGLISFRIYWFDLLAVQGTLKSLLQQHSLKASVLWHSAFFAVQLSPPYMTTGKTTALTRWTFVAKVMSFFFLICCIDCS